MKQVAFLGRSYSSSRRTALSSSMMDSFQVSCSNDKCTNCPTFGTQALVWSEANYQHRVCFQFKTPPLSSHLSGVFLSSFIRVLVTNFYIVDRIAMNFTAVTSYITWDRMIELTLTVLNTVLNFRNFRWSTVV